MSIIFATNDFITEAECILRFKHPAWCAAHNDIVTRGAVIARAGKVHRTSQHLYGVNSLTQRTLTYRVDRQASSCQCKAYDLGQKICSHRVAVYLAVEAEQLERDWRRWELAMDAEDLRQVLDEVPA